MYIFFQRIEDSKYENLKKLNLERIRYESAHVYEWSFYSKKETEFCESNIESQWKLMAPDILKTKYFEINISSDELSSIALGIYNVINKSIEHHLEDSSFDKNYENFFSNFNNNYVASTLFCINDHK